MKITLCGSTRFIEIFREWNKWLALQGHTVYSVATSVKGDFTPTVGEKETLDLVHLYKIVNSDEILVINCLLRPHMIPDVGPGPKYIGESTRREIKWARILNRRVRYISDENVLILQNHMEII